MTVHLMENITSIFNSLNTITKETLIYFIITAKLRKTVQKKSTTVNFWGGKQSFSALMVIDNCTSLDKVENFNGYCRTNPLSNNRLVRPESVVLIEDLTP